MPRPRKKPEDRKDYHLRVPLTDAQRALIEEASKLGGQDLAGWGERSYCKLPRKQFARLVKLAIIRHSGSNANGEARTPTTVSRHPTPNRGRLPIPPRSHCPVPSAFSLRGGGRRAGFSSLLSERPESSFDLNELLSPEQFGKRSGWNSGFGYDLASRALDFGGQKRDESLFVDRKRNASGQYFGAAVWQQHREDTAFPEFGRKTLMLPLLTFESSFNQFKSPPFGGVGFGRELGLEYPRSNLLGYSSHRCRQH